jgi:hypothetical protein
MIQSARAEPGADAKERRHIKHWRVATKAVEWIPLIHGASRKLADKIRRAGPKAERAHRHNHQGGCKAWDVALSFEPYA